jgi:hypothetical protein
VKVVLDPLAKAEMRDAAKRCNGKLEKKKAWHSEFVLDGGVSLGNETVESH